MSNMKHKFTVSILLAVCAIMLSACGAGHYVKRGDKRFALGEYYSAAMDYKTAYSKTSPKDRQLRGRRALKLAQTYRRINYNQQAVAAYRNAIRYGQDSAQVHLGLADVLMRTASYKAAEAEYAAAIERDSACKAAAEGLATARNAAETKKKASAYTVKRVDTFNSRRSDYSPVLQGDDADKLYITTTRNEAEGSQTSRITGVKAGDVFVSTKDAQGRWQRPEAITDGLNSELDEGACSFSPDGSKMYLTQCGDGVSSIGRAYIVVSHRTDAQWAEPKPIMIAADTIHNFAHPAVSPDGVWLYFTSDMPGGCGGYDLWRARITPDGVGVVENIGAPVNTAGDEVFPTFSRQGDLYFSSNGHGGMGGLDILAAHPDGPGGAYVLEHPGYPLNSQGDDFGMTFLPGDNAGYFASNRGDAHGWDHIYSFVITENIRSVRGYVYEQDGYELTAAQVYMVGDDGTNLRLSVKGDGSFTHTLNPGTRYVFLGTCRGFLNHKEELNVAPNDSAGETVLQFALASIRVPVLVDNVFYDFDKATLRPESEKALNELVSTLNENPNVAIELSAHCDYKGGDDYNQRLSQRRAESVVSYLIAHGIDRRRLKAKGYGKQMPRTVTRRVAEKHPWLKVGEKLTAERINALPQDKQEVCNQLNRRTEFRVISSTYGIITPDGHLNDKFKTAKRSVETTDDDIIVDE